jgi:hypothetical protein
MIIKQIKRGMVILASPRQEFTRLNKISLEEVVADYFRLLIAAGIAAGVFNLIYSLLRSLYLDIFVNITIEYWRMLNYSLGRSVSLIFLYLFAGTFLLFFLSIILKPFIKRVRYISLIKILIYSLMPFLLFSWFFQNPAPLAIWSLFLFIAGIKNYNDIKIKKDSINKRE